MFGGSEIPLLQEVEDTITDTQGEKEGTSYDRKFLNDTLFMGHDPMWSGAEDGALQKNQKDAGSDEVTSGPGMIDVAVHLHCFFEDDKNSVDFKPPLVLEKNARNLERADSLSVSPAGKSPSEQGVHDVLIPGFEFDDGFDEIIDDPKPPLAGRKRPWPIDEAVPLIVADHYSEEDDRGKDFCAPSSTEAQPNDQTVTFRSSGKAVSFSCAPEATGKDLRHVVKANLVLELLDLESIDSYSFFTGGRRFEDDEQVVPNLVLDMVGLPSGPKRRKLEIEKKKKKGN
ncbi:uncharacterized protein LOC135501478 isoform X2 [Lineus longissimus]|uniref:uncharacterized protein LOC135501478 isoform X2 n=1 Tax=Lineus longissimus TaxID=88925 RepID=UPI00315C6472